MADPSSASTPSPATPAAGAAVPADPTLWNELADDSNILRSLATQNGVNPAPVELLIKFRDDHRAESHPRYWAVLDFSLHSARNRLFLFDVQGRSVTPYLAAHGKGSDPDNDGVADIFSNEDGSGCSSLGVYQCSETFYGEHGFSLRLDGLEPTNSNVRHRAIIIHRADYVSPDWIRSYGRIGRSLGCPAVEERYADDIINALQRGSLMVAWKG